MRPRLASILGTFWTIYANVAGIGLIAGQIAWAILASFATPTLPVVETVGAPRLLTPIVPYRGSLSFVLSVKRNTSCPGSVVSNFGKIRPPDAGDDYRPINVSLTRPIVNKEIKTTPDITINIQLPDTIDAGRWRLVYSTDSQCPTFTRIDKLAELYFDVEGRP